MSSAPPLYLSPRADDAHKGDFGRALLLGGSRGMSGSIALASMAALHSGSGLVTAAIPDRCLETVAAFHPGVMTIPLPDDDDGRFSLEATNDIASLLSKFDVIGCGPGMTTEPGSVRIVERVWQQQIPRVLDADALNCLADMNWRDQVGDNNSIVLTPHPGEFQRLSGVSSQDRGAQIDAALDLAQQTGVVFVLKGGPTVVIGSGDSWTNTTGNPGMATAGSGDVLTGVITALLGQGLSPWDAARLGVWIHGMAGDLAAKQTGQAGLTCRDITGALPAATNLAYRS